MTRLGITGHRSLPAHTVDLVQYSLRHELAQYGATIIGVTALADGADQLFARAVVDQGGHLEVIVPAAGYREGLPTESHEEYDDLLDQALKVHRLEFTESTSEAHMAASTLMISMIDELVAVWDQQPARGHGGTADVVTHARERGRPVRIIWPAGASRD
ncbi:MAG TPA: hypothetical protein VGJ13_15465 [Pseudonocardiaceae bacterium]